MSRAMLRCAQGLERILRNALKDALVHVAATMLPSSLMRDKRYFALWERHGYHVTPVHFFEPIPDSRALSPDLWDKKPPPPGIDFRESEQLCFLDEAHVAFASEYQKFPNRTTETREFCLENGSFQNVDAEALYCMLRQLKPSRVIEIGSGFSTLLIMQALGMNRTKDGVQSHLTVVDPFPSVVIDSDDSGVDTLIRKRVQDVHLGVLTELEENDVLFIDSSHVLTIGSDVQYECLELVPRVKPGVVVHFHDIFTPQEYLRSWIDRDRRFWTEQYVVQAFLAFNVAFEMLWSSAYMYTNKRTELERAFPSCKSLTAPPGSLWIRRTNE